MSSCGAVSPRPESFSNNSAPTVATADAHRRQLIATLNATSETGESVLEKARQRLRQVQRPDVESPSSSSQQEQLDFRGRLRHRRNKEAASTPADDTFSAADYAVDESDEDFEIIIQRARQGLRPPDSRLRANHRRAEAEAAAVAAVAAAAAADPENEAALWGAPDFADFLARRLRSLRPAQEAPAWMAALRATTMTGEDTDSQAASDILDSAASSVAVEQSAASKVQEIAQASLSPRPKTISGTPMSATTTDEGDADVGDASVSPTGATGANCSIGGEGSSAMSEGGDSDCCCIGQTDCGATLDGLSSELLLSAPEPLDATLETSGVTGVAAVPKSLAALGLSTSPKAQDDECQCRDGCNRQIVPTASTNEQSTSLGDRCWRLLNKLDIVASLPLADLRPRLDFLEELRTRGGAFDDDVHCGGGQMTDDCNSSQMTLDAPALTNRMLQYLEPESQVEYNTSSTDSAQQPSLSLPPPPPLALLPTVRERHSDESSSANEDSGHQRKQYVEDQLLSKLQQLQRQSNSDRQRSYRRRQRRYRFQESYDDADDASANCRDLRLVDNSPARDST